MFSAYPSTEYKIVHFTKRTIHVIRYRITKARVQIDRALRMRNLRVHKNERKKERIPSESSSFQKSPRA